MTATSGVPRAAEWIAENDALVSRRGIASRSGDAGSGPRCCCMDFRPGLMTTPKWLAILIATLLGGATLQGRLVLDIVARHRALKPGDQTALRRR
jgi:hypothetical protein